MAKCLAYGKLSAHLLHIITPAVLQNGISLITQESSFQYSTLQPQTPSWTTTWPWFLVVNMTNTILRSKPTTSSPKEEWARLTWKECSCIVKWAHKLFTALNYTSFNKPVAHGHKPPVLAGATQLWISHLLPLYTRKLMLAVSQPASVHKFP